MTFLRRALILLVVGSLAGPATLARAQGLGGAGTVQGTVKDATGGVLPGATVVISNAVTGFNRNAVTDAQGLFVFRNLPPNGYRVQVSLQGFKTIEKDVDVRTAVPIDLGSLTMAAAVSTSVEVVGTIELVERDPTAHTDVDQSLIAKLPVETAAGLNQVITLASPGVVADSNGFFHPVGDHAQTQFSIDNQPITDQQSRIYSNQISADAVQAMEIITGVAPAEYGDKSSLIVHIVTKSGLDHPKPTGTATFGYGSFGSPSTDLNVGAGSHSVGDFLSLTATSTDRYLDPPEFDAIHDHGHSVSFFNRFDAHPSDANSLFFNVQAASSGFDVPNSYDTLQQAQHQDITTYNVAPGYSRVIGNKALLTANAFVRHDHLTYSPSSDPFDDTPATVSQDRTLTNFGFKVDYSYFAGRNNLKMGGAVTATQLHENFTFGITDPTAPDFADENGDFNQDLAPYDLTNGGSPLIYDQSFTVKQQSAYVQDDITAGHATFKLGLRLDHYDGLVSSTQAEPRLGVSYALPTSGTVLRASYGRTMETPYNENLLLSGGYGLNGLFGVGEPVPVGKRNEGEIGIQQAFGRWVVADFGYFNKHTTNGYDFGVLFSTPIAFPVAWDHSRLNGFTGRINLIEHGGFSAFVVMAHTNAIFSPPGVGGILLEQAPGDFRIDHDQKFNATTNVQYVLNKTAGAWIGLIWRYDSGLVAGAVGSLDDALALTAAQQAAIGFYCGNAVATRDQALTSAECTPSNYGATRLRIPAEGTEDDVTNPPRIAPRHLFDLGIGADNLLRTGKAKLRVRFSVINLTNEEALYNFLSTFSGTHFVTPRAYKFEFGVTF
ncbi:MAG TPA: TonB-dependent receptor [Vicinamibacterales bacterium]|nr:TonB-dependent receptor [Vicinamibacterales bacterium]